MCQNPHRERITASGGGNSQLVASLYACLNFEKVGKVLRGFSPQDDQNQQYAVILSDSEESLIRHNLRRLHPQDDVTTYNNVNCLFTYFLTSLFPSKNKKAAFTLAEVLITLGIIGVVAAMTMPVLFANIKDVVLENQVKKAKSVLINGVKLLMAQDDVTNLDQTTLANCEDSECVKAEIQKAFKIMGEFDNSQIVKYTIDDKTDEDVWSDGDIVYKFSTMDGTSYGLKKFDKGADSLIFVADINGIKKPNTSCKDLLTFTVSGNSIAEGCDFASDCSVDNLSACSEKECRAMEGSYSKCHSGVVQWWDGGHECFCGPTSGEEGGEEE